VIFLSTRYGQQQQQAIDLLQQLEGTMWQHLATHAESESDTGGFAFLLALHYCALLLQGFSMI
jgi:hypothetical protein